MELDHTNIQLIFNVTMITGVTSLALICRLLKRDNQQLASELKQRNERPWIRPAATTKRDASGSSASGSSASDLSATALKSPECTATPDVAPRVQQDIREFVAQRAGGWVVSVAATGR